MASSVLTEINKKIQGIKNRLSPKQRNLFGNLTTNKDRIAFASENSFTKEFDKQEDYLQKSEDEARNFREEGNTLFRQKKYRDALLKYNRGVLVAPFSNDAGSTELSLLLANRSAALFYLGRYKECLSDVDVALQKGYPIESHHKLHDRAGKCYIKLNNIPAATNSFQTALDCIKSIELDEKSRNNWIRTIDKQLDTCQSNKITNGLIHDQQKKSVSIPKLSSNKSSLFPCATEAVGMGENPMLGRFLTAKQDIHVGDVIAIEKPFASIIYPEFYHSHCHHCFKSVMVPYPCRQCAGVVYCGIDCETAAWDSHHHYECNYMNKLSSAWVGRLGHLALRMAVMTQYPYLIEQFSETKKPKAGSVWQNNYLSACALVKHESSRNLETDLMLTVMAVYLTEILRCTDYCGVNNNNINTNLVAEAVLSHLQIVQCNAFGIAEMQTAGDFKNSKPLDIGLGLYCFGSLTNHSCDPSLESYYYGDTCVTRAIKDISSGEELYIDYGALFYVHQKEYRKAMLETQYFFECRCLACLNDWSTWDAIESQKVFIKCEECASSMAYSTPQNDISAECKACGHKQDLSKKMTSLHLSHGPYVNAMQKATDGQILDALPIFLAHLSLMQKLVCQPWQEFYSCQSAIKQCFRMMANVRDSNTK